MPGGMSFSLEGFHELQRRLEVAGAATGRLAVSAGLYREGLRLLATSQPLVPVDTGALRASGHVTLPKVEGTVVEVDVGYGGNAASYAIYVHEITSNYHRPPTQAKFLEQPAMAAQAGLAERLGNDVKVILKI